MQSQGSNFVVVGGWAVRAWWSSTLECARLSANVRQVRHFDSVLQPIESHVHGSGSSDFGTVVDKSFCDGVVCCEYLGYVCARPNVVSICWMKELFVMVEEGSGVVC
jgi:hypothetical protein